MIFRSAITGRDGSVDPGYLAIFWTMATTVTLIPLAVALGYLLAWAHPEHAGEILMATAAVAGALGVQCGAIIGAVGMYRMGDRDRTTPPSGAPTAAVVDRVVPPPVQ